MAAGLEKVSFPSNPKERQFQRMFKLLPNCIHLIWVKASASNLGDPGSIPGSGRSPGEGNANPLQYSLVWKIAWMEKPGRLQSTGSQRVGHN